MVLCHCVMVTAAGERHPRALTAAAAVTVHLRHHQACASPELAAAPELLAMNPASPPTPEVCAVAQSCRFLPSIPLLQSCLRANSASFLRPPRDRICPSQRRNGATPQQESSSAAQTHTHRAPFMSPSPSQQGTHRTRRQSPVGAGTTTPRIHRTIVAPSSLRRCDQSAPGPAPHLEATTLIVSSTAFGM